MRRTLQAIPLLLAISVILYGILYNMPGGPWRRICRTRTSRPRTSRASSTISAWTSPFRFNTSKWLGHVLVGDFGYSTSNSEPVLQALLERLPATLELMGASLFVAIAIGVGAGIISAVYRYSALDYVITTLAHSSAKRCRCFGLRS